MMRKHKAFVLSAAIVAIVGIAAIAVTVLAQTGVLAQAGTERLDCPGKIVCPQTGELVCRDKCPTLDASRPDCPGRVVCPLSGELVCKDRCPLQKNDALPRQTEGKTPPCCAKKGR